MPTIINPTQAELDKFYTLCADVEMEFNASRIRGRYVGRDRYTNLLTKMKVFLLKLKYTNLSSMLAYVNRRDQYELIQLIRDMLPTPEIFPTVDENDYFNILCEEIHQEQILPANLRSTTRKINLSNAMRSFITKMQATNMLSMTSRAANLNQYKTVWVIIHHTKNVNERDIDGNTVLHIVAKLNSPQKVNGWFRAILGRLLDKRYDLDAINSENKSALDIAAELGNVCMVKELLKVGANLFGNQYSKSTLDLIHTMMLDKSVNETTPLLGDIERIVNFVDNSVRSRVEEIEALVIQERNLAVMMSTHKRLGNHSRIHHLDENILKLMVLKEINRDYTTDYLQNLSTDDRRKMIINAYAIHKTLTSEHAPS